MKSSMKIILAGYLALGALSAQAAPILYSDEATFLTDLGSSRTFDFETASGFPAGGGNIGIVDGVNFDAQTFLETSGGQSMTGSSGTFSTAAITFGAPTTGFGFIGLDLTVGEVIRVTVDFATQPDGVFDISLGGAARLTPIYFGLIDTVDSILGISVFGTDTGGGPRAWLIDDLSINALSVPEPEGIALFGLGLAGLGLARYKKRKQAKLKFS